MNFIDEVWEGKRSLAETFWLWNIVFSRLAVVGIGSLILPAVVLVPLALIVTIWIYVGLWRCAGNNPGYWAILVKILVIIGCIDVVYALSGGHS